MIKNYLKVAWRSLWRNKVFSTINIFGLSIGIATCLLILLYLQNELSFDRFNTKADRMVRVVFRGTVQGENMNEANVMPPTAHALKADYPEVEEATRLRDAGTTVIVNKDKTFKNDKLAYVDSNFFQVFTLPLLQGNEKTVLVEPNSVVITKEMARKYFGEEDPIGKSLNFKNLNTSVTITGLIDRVPVNSHFQFDFFMSMASLPEANESSWMQSNFYTYLVLQEGYNYKKLEGKLPQVIEKYIGPQLMQGIGVTLAQFRSKGNDLGLYLQPLTDIHLHSDFANDLSPSGDIKYIYIFGAIAIFMLLIACINFMNLSTASASKRSREVGIRKVLGSQKIELVRQFLAESLLVTLIALIISVGLVYLALPFFNQLTGIDLSLHTTGNAWFLPGILLVGLVTGIIAGSYPAFYLSSFNPVTVLRNRFRAGKNSIGLRSGLVVFQFFISIILIVCTTVVYTQLSYIQHKKLGYQKEKVLVLPGTYLLGNNEQVFRNKLMQDTRIVEVSASNYLPAGNSSSNNFFIYAGSNANQIVKTLRYDVDYNYIPTLGMELQSGRNFSKEFGADTMGIIINETAARSLGWESGAVGNTISTVYKNDKNRVYTVIGVVKDFHFKSLHELISPLVMVLGDQSGNIIVKAKTADLTGLLEFMKKNWSELTTEEPFTYSFLDDRFNNTYQSEQMIGKLLALFAGLTIFVACLGLFGLAAFTAEQRTKEIGVRKVLGANVASILQLISKDFLKLVLIANGIAWPLAWWVMNRWLQDFAYRITISWWIFIVAGFLAIILTVITVSFQAIKAALMNPVKSLKSE